MFRHKPLLLLGSLPVLALAACGGSGAATASSVQAGPGRAAAAAQAPAVAAPAARAGKPAANGSLPTANLPPGTRLQRSGTIVLQVPNGHFDSALEEVIAVAEAAGGYISGQDAQAADQGQPLRSGQVTFQVPADKLDSVMNAIGKKGKEQSVNVGSTDVSLQYVDLQARLSNAEAQRDAMLALMRNATSVNDTIQVENQLGQITGQIEQLKGQIDYLDRTTTYATLAVTIREAAVTAPHDEWGIQSAASQGLHNFTAVVAFLIVAIATLAPLLVAAATAFWAGRLAWRRMGARA